VPKIIPVAVHPVLVVADISIGQVIVGFTASTTVTNCVQVPILPEPSTAVQVTVVFPNGKATGALFVNEAILQFSVTKGMSNTNPVKVQPVFVCSTIAGAQCTTGATLSVTVTVCVHVAVLPEPSVMVQVTVVFPNGYTNKPLFVTEATWQLSLVVGVPKVTPTAVHPTLVTVKTVPGHVIVGLTLSVIVTNCSQVDVLPEPSVIIQVMAVTPNGKALGALFVTEAILQLSEVIGDPKEIPVAVHPVLVIVAMFDGHVILGATLSLTVINCVQIAVLPAPSVTVQVTNVLPSEYATGALLTKDAT
jgi:hypothetical protein